MSIGSLRDYQYNALVKMRNGCILNGGVGSGKSRTSLAYYYKLMGGTLYYYKKNQKGDYTDGPYEDGKNYISKNAVYKKMINPIDLYIITTARKRDSKEWEGELAQFLMTTDKENSIYKNKIVIDSWNNIQKYEDTKNAFFIFDEQRVVGYGAWSKAFIKIARANRWILLSATPGDTWSDYIPVFIANGFYRNKSEFINKHIVYSNFTNYPKIDRYINVGILLKMRNHILIDMDFKRNTVRNHCYKDTSFNSEAYNKVVKERWNIFKNEPIKTAGEYCGVLRRIVNTDKSRLDEVMWILGIHPKAIIFYSYDYELDVLRDLLSKSNYLYSEWNGHKHETIPTGKAWAYLVEYAAGSEAWNCIATDTIIFYSQTYSYRTMEQACGRIDRLNTPYKDLYYYHLISDATIDRAIKKDLTKKKKFNEVKFAPDFSIPLQKGTKYEQMTLLE